MEDHPNPDLIRAYDRMIEIGWLVRYAYSEAGIAAEYTALGIRRIDELYGLLTEIAAGSDFHGFEQIGRGFLIAALLKFGQIPPARSGDGG